MTRISGLKKAVGDYQRLNAGGPYDAHYGVMMYDTSDGKIWTDEFYDLGHNSWKEYHSESIYNISGMMEERADGEKAKITMATVKAFIEEVFPDGRI